MIVACLVTLFINGNLEEHYMTGELKATIGNHYVVDFSNVSSFLGNKEDMSKYIVDEENCVVRTKK